MRPQRLHPCMSALAATACMWIMTGISQCESTDADLDGYSVEGGDCNDSDAAIYPGAQELCDGLDRSCDGMPAALVLWYGDADGDGFGSGEVGPQRTCTAPSGMAPKDGDCDDANVSRHPGAQEQCDQVDNDCDLGVDEGLLANVWRDADGDGFGSLSDVRCGGATGYVARRGDCNDASSTVHPGAADQAGDGVDSDCGGADGAQPHVGLSSGSLSTLAAALNQATEGTTIWVGPGVYQETGLSFGGRTLQLQSTDMAEKTVVDGNKQGRMFRFVQGETNAAVLDGFTLRRGRMNPGDGGAMYIQNSSPTLKNLVFVDNQAIGPSDGSNAGGHGGAVVTIDGSPVFVQCRFEGNRATGLEGPDCLDGCTAIGGQGGALMIHGGEVVVGASVFESNVAELAQKTGGGAVWTEQGRMNVKGSLFLHNSGRTYGGALLVLDGELELEQSVLDNNDACEGAGLRLGESVASVRYTTIQNNAATCEGGGIYSSESTLNIEYSAIQSNQAQNMGGGIYLSNMYTVTEFDIRYSVITENMASKGGGAFVNTVSGTFTNNITASNASEYGGGLYLYDYCTPILTNNIFLNNYGYDIYNDEHWTATPIVMYNVLHTQQPVVTNLADLSESNVLMDPEIIRFTSNRSSADDDLLLSPASDAHDLGDPGIPDPDGSRSEPGLGGGPMGAGAYYQDSDGDGLYDGWELRYFGHLSSSSGSDSDTDGLNNGVELVAGLYPIHADSDNDGTLDGEEYASGSDALDWYHRPSGWVSASVPAQFDTLQAAIDAGQKNVSILLAPGTYSEQLYILGKSVSIVGTDTRDSTILDGEGEHRAVLGYWSNISLRHLSVQNGSCPSCLLPGGGGIAVQDSGILLEDVRLHGNSADEGGALSVSRGPVGLTDVLFDHNTADYVGGAVWTVSSDMQLSGVHFYRNTAGVDAGAIKAYYPQLMGDHVSFLENSVSRDGGAFIAIGDSTLTNDASVVMTHVEARGNVAGTDSAAFYLYNVTGALSHATVTGNTAGIKLLAPASYTYTLENAIIAYNTAGNIEVVNEYDMPQGAGQLVVRNSNSYNPSGAINYLGVNPSPTLTALEPGFLSYAGGVPSDPHLARTSPLINAGAPGATDADGSQVDLGMFGGPDGDSWDRDYDGYPSWYWPGTRADAPSMVVPSAFDLDDLNSTVH